MKKVHGRQCEHDDGVTHPQSGGAVAQGASGKDPKVLTVCIESLHSITAMLAFLDYMYNPANAKNNAHMDNIARKGGREIFAYVRGRIKSIVCDLNELRVEKTH